MTPNEQKKAAAEFAARWKDQGYEKGQSQQFWMDLLVSVFGVQDIKGFISFEDQVQLDHTSFIDGYIPSTHVMIEQKSLGKDLRKAIKQSDGQMLSPFQQAKRYAAELPYSQRPRWIITCNFAEFNIYDMEKPNGEPEIIFLKDFPKEYYRMQFLVDSGSELMKQEMEISLKAGEIVGALYDALLKQYADPTAPATLQSLNKLCVRLVFCLYAEDANIFGKHMMFHDYMKQFDAKSARKALIELFQVLDTKTDDRDPYMEEDLAAFPYVNGGLFADEHIEIPRLTDEIMDLILRKASEDFDWSGISPTIFGAVFESTLNPETRRSGGMHYTSIENIHKVIDPLFLDDLRQEYESIVSLKDVYTRRKRLPAFQEKLASLCFLDPACGSGNFLTETYLSLRKLENEVIAQIVADSSGQVGGQMMLGAETLNPIMVSIGQFYGIEINDFAVTVAKTALWIAESQMMQETERLMNIDLDFLPLKSYANIVEGNALRIDWESVIPKDRLSFLMGNPPFIGASLMTKEQKDDAVKIFGKIKLSNSIDYVGAWYFKACELISGTDVKAALVSTNSITQGEQVAPLWETLFERYGIHIDFAYRTFRWDSEANLKAHVHCVIIGFSQINNIVSRKLFDGNRYIAANNINSYLVDAPTVFLKSRSKPICDVVPMVYGNKPTDDGNLILSVEEREELLKTNPDLEFCIRRYVGARDFINNNEIRYCLWLKGVSPSVYRGCKEIQKRLALIKEFRENSTAAPTRKYAEKPYLFFSAPHNDCTYLIVPRHSSEKRKYIPIGFMQPDIIAADSCSIIPNATLYEFGVLISNVHMAWVKTVCGRIKSDFRYSGSVVYNNFPWCNPTPEQKAKIEKTAQMILDARAAHPDCSLADLYDELTMPSDLRKAHQANDKAVMEAYGFWGKLNSESECVAELMKMYQALTEGK